MTPASVVSLREITESSLLDVLRLKVREGQERFVATNAVSIAQAHFSRVAWFRAIYADEIPVGFVMISDDPAKPEYGVWRFMIDARYQGMGFGRRAMQALIAHVRTRPGARELFVSCVEGEGTPIPFYESLGFRLTGAYDEGEAIMRLDLSTESTGAKS
ncbi:MAG: GNAT family N-acetyltransferase [Opitutaceae bacterium]|nr:GNAT family N-acetyltransferase [Opitutaceae bacterium]